MRRIILPALAITVLSLLPLGAANAVSPQQFAQAEGSSPVVTIQVGQRDRICCQRGWQNWWASRRQCQHARGIRAANRECRGNWNDRWDVRWWNWQGRDWNDRVCCSRDGLDWWTTARGCRDAFGYETAYRACRR
jgi:hypothetical protein